VKALVFVIEQSNDNREGKSNDKWRKKMAINVDESGACEVL